MYFKIGALESRKVIGKLCMHTAGQPATQACMCDPQSYYHVSTISTTDSSARRLIVILCTDLIRSEWF